MPLSSVEFEPSRVTTAPGSTVWFAPAHTTGGSLSALTVTRVAALERRPAASVTVSSNTRVSQAPVWGATKVSHAESAAMSSTGVPAICFHW